MCARGSAFFLLGRYQEAMGDLNHALRLKPDYQEARNVLSKTQEAIVRAEVAKDAPVLAAVSAKPATTAEPEVAAPKIEPKPVEKASARSVKTKTPAVEPKLSEPKVTDWKNDAKSAAQHNQAGRDLLSQGKYREP